jgi:methanogenic corrinoid protein MtbC1
MPSESLDKLKEAILEYDTKEAIFWVERALNEGIDPLLALNALTEAILVVGEGFGRGELFLPDLVGAANAMQGAMPLLQEAILQSGRAPVTSGTVVIGTVFGDIHSIGKGMVSTLLVAAGFTVHDLGINVTAEAFVEATRAYKPDILAMSALLTTTAREQQRVIETLRAEDLKDKVKVIVGGGAITQEFADKVGADGYGATAFEAVELAKRLVVKHGAP